MSQPLGVSADRLTMTNQGGSGGGGGGGAGGGKLSQLAVGCMRRVEFAGCLVEGHVLSELLELKPLETLRWVQRELTCS
jgi:hypothetical protein